MDRGMREIGALVRQIVHNPGVFKLHTQDSWERRNVTGENEWKRENGSMNERMSKLMTGCRQTAHTKYL
jgi:hypothetical protein